MSGHVAARALAARIEGLLLVVDLVPATAPLWADRLYLAFATIPSLVDATPLERGTIEIICDGEGLCWPLLDEHLTVSGLIRGAKIIDWKRRFASLGA